MDILTPPPERDLPDWRVTELRSRVMAGTDRPTRPRVRRTLLAATGVATALAVAAVATATLGGSGKSQVLAFGPGTLSPELTSAVDQCLRNNAPQHLDPSSPDDTPLTVRKGDLAVGVQNGDDRALAFVTDEGYLTCQYTDRGEGSGGMAQDRWTPQRREWLPGPVERLLLMSTDVDSGDVTVIGRASAEVRRVVLEYGNGHTSEARLDNGMFALLSDGERVTGRAVLVSHDADDRVIGRMSLFGFHRDESCFTDPAGNVVYGKADGPCHPAFHWR